MSSTEQTEEASVQTNPPGNLPDICHHVMTNGSLCNGVALRDHKHCYFHHRDRQRQARLLRALDHKRSTLSRWATPDGLCQSPQMTRPFDDHSAAMLQALALPLLEDMASVQVAITNVIRAIATQQIDCRAGGLILYGLQMASSNMKHISTLMPDDSEYVCEPNEYEPLPPTEFETLFPKKPAASAPVPSASEGLAGAPCLPDPGRRGNNSSVGADVAVASVPPVPSAPPAWFAPSTPAATPHDSGAPCLPDSGRRGNNNSVVSSDIAVAPALSAFAVAPAQRLTPTDQRLASLSHSDVLKMTSALAAEETQMKTAHRILGKAATNGKALRTLLERIELADASRKKAPTNGSQLHRSLDSATPPPQRAALVGDPGTPRSG